MRAIRLRLLWCNVTAAMPAHCITGLPAAGRHRWRRLARAWRADTQPGVDLAQEVVRALVLRQTAGLEGAQHGTRVSLLEEARVLWRREAGVLAPEQQERHIQPLERLARPRIQPAGDEAGGGEARPALVGRREVVIHQVVADFAAVVIYLAQIVANAGTRRDGVVEALTGEGRAQQPA